VVGGGGKRLGWRVGVLRPATWTAGACCAATRGCLCGLGWAPAWGCTGSRCSCYRSPQARSTGHGHLPPRRRQAQAAGPQPPAQQHLQSGRPWRPWKPAGLRTSIHVVGDVGRLEQPGQVGVPADDQRRAAISASGGFGRSPRTGSARHATTPPSPA
jgi:hypothetical protein